jgi:DHA1 family bicyclomycin/chloramphenicol resistance-like MFS transporter
MLAALVVFGPLAVDLYLPALPAIGQDLGVPAGQVQTTLTAFLAGFCLGMLIYGPVSDAIGRRPVALFGTVLFLGSSLACAFAPSVEWLAALRFVQAIGGGATAVMGRSMVRDVFPGPGMARALSLVALVTAITPMLAPLLGGQVLALADWRMIFFLLAAYGGAVCLLIWFAIPESLPRERRTQGRLLRAMGIYATFACDPRAWACALTAGGSFGAMFAYIAGTPFVYIDYFGVSPQAYGFLFAANIAAQMFGTWLNSRTVGRLGTGPVSRSAALVGFAGAASLAWACLTGSGGLWMIALSLAPVIGVTVILSSNMTAQMMGYYPNNAGAAAAVIVSMSFGVGALSSFAVGLLQDESPVAMGVVVLACSSLSVLSSLIAGRRVR